MKDSIMILLAIFTSLLGLSLLYWVALNIEVQTIPLEQINEELLGKIVNVQGTVSEIKTYETVTSFTLVENNSQIKIFTSFPLIIEQSTNVQIIGTIQEYQDELEIVVKQPSDIQLI